MSVTADTVNAFQTSGRLHPLICPIDATPLVARDTDRGVWLSCDTCGADIRLSEKAADVVARAMALPDDKFVHPKEPR